MGSEEEVWLDLEGTDGQYRVSNMGRVFVKDTVVTRMHKGTLVKQPRKGGFLKGCVMKVGYRSFTYRVNGETIQEYGHRLVARHFLDLPNDPKKKYVCHLNGDKLDNRVCNLRYDTATGNAKDRLKHGTDAVGENNPRSVLTESLVLEIRKLFSSGLEVREIANRMGLKRTTVSSVAHRYRWRHLDE